MRLMTLALTGLLGIHVTFGAVADDRIRPYEENPYFWQYKGEPVLLIGGSDHDNLFNHPEVGPQGLESHLDLLAACGGSYVRSTMSSRGDTKPWPFAKDDATGLYDLTRPDPEFWRRFKQFIEWTAERDIIVQIEVFDRFDYAQEWWERNPFNPKNNINYSADESGLPEVVPNHAGRRENTFFRSVPELANNTVLLPYQQALVDEMLAITLPHGHVLYCISNETNEEAEWGAYWARYIRRAGEAANAEVHVTEMWDPWDLSHPMHRRTLDHPELYTFVDISQNNHQTGQSHWDNAQALRQRLAAAPRPINNVKMYGGLTHGGGYEEGLRKLWRNILGGMASARFHRPGEWTPDGPPWGAGLSPEAQAYLRSARVIMDALGWPEIEPDLSFAQLALDPAGNVQTEKTYIVYTRDADGAACLYINGDPIVTGTSGGDLSSWDPAMHLLLAAEATGDRAWQGVFHQVALHHAALTPADIAAHYAAQAPLATETLAAHYTFDAGRGDVIPDRSGQTPPLDLHVADPTAVTWREDGLAVEREVRIATREPADRLTKAIQQSNAMTLEAWVTPAALSQSGPARIVSLSHDQSHRNFTLGQDDTAFAMRFRSTTTSPNGLPGLETGIASEASIAAARSLDRTRAAIFVSHGMGVHVNQELLAPDRRAQWFDPMTAEWRDAQPNSDGAYPPPSSKDWLLVLR